jgi:hypothetical protein
MGMEDNQWHALRSAFSVKVMTEAIYNRLTVRYLQMFLRSYMRHILVFFQDFLALSCITLDLCGAQLALLNRQ